MTLEFDDFKQLTLVNDLFKSLREELFKKDKTKWTSEDYMLNNFFKGFLFGTSDDF